MTREALEKAANRAAELIDDGVFEVGSHWHVLLEAAQRQLVLMPEPCEHGQTEPHGPFMFRNADGSIRRNCPGKVYPQETVERLTEVWRTLWDRPPYFPWKDLPENHREHLLKEARAAAVAVLDALGETE